MYPEQELLPPLFQLFFYMGNITGIALFVWFFLTYIAKDLKKQLRYLRKNFIKEGIKDYKNWKNN